MLKNLDEPISVHEKAASVAAIAGRRAGSKMWILVYELESLRPVSLGGKRSIDDGHGSVCKAADGDGRVPVCIPPRPLGAAPLRFLVMSMVGQITALFPQGPGASATPPFSDFTIGGVALSGVSGPSASGCTHFVLKPPVNGKESCVEVTEYFQYRALMSASFTLSGALSNNYATATGLTTTAEDALGHALQTSVPFTWGTTERGPLPF